MPVVYSVLAVVAAYLLGSLSFAVIVTRVMGLNDPRTYGSKNPGATNVLRSGSKAAAVITLLLDAVKGWLPVVLVRWFGEPYGLGEGTQALAGLAAFLGHLWPVFFRFEGGKGVATALGVLVGISGWLGLVVALVWLVVAAVSRYSSLASLSAAVLAPVIYVLASGQLWYSERSIVAAIVAMSALLIWRHRENISRLIQGKESRLGSKGKDQGAPQDTVAKAPPQASQRKKHKRH
ncbi:MAG: glycerol-3-phosphate 1-O-acyltransferase PlsY [Giesbergeria sp.]|nr:glycerol-3-phosphate 1-O-acyltransferase PlsY [Giesbergeria sp.]